MGKSEVQFFNFTVSVYWTFLSDVLLLSSRLNKKGIDYVYFCPIKFFIIVYQVRVIIVVCSIIFSSNVSYANYKFTFNIPPLFSVALKIWSIIKLKSILNEYLCRIILMKRLRESCEHQYSHVVFLEKSLKKVIPGN